jgi:hypothetical protein
MQFVIPGCKEDPPKRAASKMVHLTYAALYDGELSHDQLLAAARRWASTRHGLREYVIGQELHSQPADPLRAKHMHAYLKFGTKIDVADRHHTTIFDLPGRNGRVLHPELQAVKLTAADRERVINYDMKDGDYVAKLATPLVNDRRRDAAEAEAEESEGEGETACLLQVYLSSRWERNAQREER